MPELFFFMISGISLVNNFWIFNILTTIEENKEIQFQARTILCVHMSDEYSHVVKKISKGGGGQSSTIIRSNYNFFTR